MITSLLPRHSLGSSFNLPLPRTSAEAKGTFFPLRLRASRSKLQSLDPNNLRSLKEWKMSSVRPSNLGCTLDIVQCFYNIARHFSCWKVPFSALIKLHILLTVLVLNKKKRLVFQKHISFYTLASASDKTSVSKPHISRPAQNISLRCQGKRLFKVYSFKMMQPLKSLGFFESF